MKERSEEDYRDKFGVIVMCMHCCRTQRGRAWELVEAFIANRPMNVSDGLCPECLEEHYPAD
jgi:hypothetical protein